MAYSRRRHRIRIEICSMPIHAIGRHHGYGEENPVWQPGASNWGEHQLGDQEITQHVQHIIYDDNYHPDSESANPPGTLRDDSHWNTQDTKHQ